MNSKTLEKDLGLVNPSDRRLPDDKTYRLGSKTSSLVSAGLRGHERLKSRGAADFFDLSTSVCIRMHLSVSKTPAGRYFEHIRVHLNASQCLNEMLKTLCLQTFWKLRAHFFHEVGLAPKPSACRYFEHLTVK